MEYLSDKLPKDDVQKFQLEKNDMWNLGNKVLYDLCDEYPDHTDDQKIVAKVWLIGRSYAAAVERGRSVDTDAQTTEAFYKLVAEAIKGANIDKRLSELKNGNHMNTRPETETFRLGLELHAELLHALYFANGSNKRSFCSKYLHFHARNAFFIYDSIAARGLSTLLPRIQVKNKISTEGPRAGIDETYWKFVNKVYYLREKLWEIHSITLSPREIDRLLLHEGNTSSS